ncbi:MAG: hypothetical protein ACR2RB_21430, partial [Gammaproteobacteria bacterium]
MAKASHDPALDDLHGDFGLGFVFGFIRARGHDGHLVVGGELLIAGIDVGFVAVGFVHSALQV